MSNAPFSVRAFKAFIHCLALWAPSLIQAAPPEFLSTPSGRAFTQEVYRYEVDVSDPDRDGLFVRAERLPGWLSQPIADDPLDAWVETISGGLPGLRDGEADEARFGYSYSLFVAPDDAVYIMDRENQAVRRLSDGEVSTVHRGQYRNGYSAIVDTDGVLYVLDELGGFGFPWEWRILAIPSNNLMREIARGEGTVGGMEMDSQGNLVVWNTTNLGGDTFETSRSATSFYRISPEGEKSLILRSVHQGEPLEGIDGNPVPPFDRVPNFGAWTMDDNDNIYTVDDFLLYKITPEGKVGTYSDLPITDIVLNLDWLPSGRLLMCGQYSVAVADIQRNRYSRIAGSYGQDAPAGRDGQGSEATFRGISDCKSDSRGLLYLLEVDFFPDEGQQKFSGIRTITSRVDSLSGTPGADDAGSHEVVLSVTDLVDTRYQRFSVEVLSRLNLQDQTRQNMTLPANVLVEGGTLGGVVRGQVEAPAYLSARLADNTLLRNVVVDHGAVVEGRLRVGENVRFAGDELIPTGTNLTGAYPSLVPANGWPNSSALPDLSQDVVAGASLLDDLRLLHPRFRGLPGLLQDDEGSLLLDLGDEVYALRPTSVEQADVPPGLSFLTDGSVSLVTARGRRVNALPVLADPAGFAEHRAESDAVLEGNEGVLLLESPREGRRALRPAMQATLAEAGSSPGIGTLPHPRLPGSEVLVHRFESAGDIMQQHLYPFPYELDALRSYLEQQLGAELVVLEDGSLTLTWMGQGLYVVADGELREGGEAGMAVLGVEDRNGDGTEDYLVRFDDGTEQYFYRLPLLLGRP